MQRDDAQLPLPTETIDRALRAGVRTVRLPQERIPDLVQEAWVVLLTKLDRLAGAKPSALEAYIRRIGRSTAIDHLRRHAAIKRGGQTTTVPLDDAFGCSLNDPSPENLAVTRETLRSVIREVARRSPRLSQVLALLAAGLEPVEVAERLQVSRNAVDSVVYRARVRWAARQVSTRP